MYGLLPSWNDGASRHAILNFVERVTDRGSPHFVPSESRVAVFDNDGTLWSEKPLPIQADFFLRRLGEMAEYDPSLRGRQPWKAAYEKDHRWLSEVITKHYRGDDRDMDVAASGLLQSFQGNTIEQFEAKAGEFLRTGKNPVLKRRYLECVYQPMVELFRFLEEAEFSCYIVSGSGRDFMRPVTETLYGVPPERVIGSSVALEYHDRGENETAEIIHKPSLDIFDDGPAKPVRIWSRVGRRPIFAVGNSNGDIPMLRFCEHPSRPSLSLLLDHDDSKREFAYEEGAEDAVRQAYRSGWPVVSIQRDWKTVFVGSVPSAESDVAA